MKALITGGAISFAVVALLLVLVVTVATGLSLRVVISRSLLAAMFFGILGGALMYLLNRFVFQSIDGISSENKAEAERKAVSQQTAAQQYDQQNNQETEEEALNESSQEKEEGFQPLDLEEIEYEEREEIDQLAEEDPEKLAQLVRNMKEN
ncbi:hypothetical protein [Fuchsiella alkaliacetigena]|uniref:hypothetical protein n=1 Tax=Fuchsiella alkaliacetigena TaxID=957042 RepID=UPI00200AC151|nr:hypothetical protein [Fuchsiella alkaliacetigena]MCK8823527.1 hypothetical protein [Fuchsiella alkaliacetigena]